MSIEEAQQMFNILMDFGMRNPDLPQKIEEAMAVVANYCGDIAMGRKPE